MHGIGAEDEEKYNNWISAFTVLTCEAVPYHSSSLSNSTRILEDGNEERMANT